MIKKKQIKKTGLIVTVEAIEDFSKLSPEYHLAWLDDARSFLSKVRPIKKYKR